MIRAAKTSDVDAINELITAFAERGLMLFRSLAELYEKIQQFVVWEEAGAVNPPSLTAGVSEKPEAPESVKTQADKQGGTVVGCCALEVVWGDLAEVKSLSVRSDCQGRGIGRRLVEAVEADARRLGIGRVFTLTREQAFFERLGYVSVPRESLPHKVWSDCIKCERLNNCDEVAMCKPLTPAGRRDLVAAVNRVAAGDRPPADSALEAFED